MRARHGAVSGGIGVSAHARAWSISLARVAWLAAHPASASIAIATITVRMVPAPMHELALRTAPVNPEIVETVRVAAIISPFSTYRIVREIAPGPTIAQIMREIGIDPRANARIFDGARLIADSERETHRPAPGAIVTIRVVPSPPALIAVAIAAAEAAATAAATSAAVTGTVAAAIGVSTTVASAILSTVVP